MGLFRKKKKDFFDNIIDDVNIARAELADIEELQSELVVDMRSQGGLKAGDVERYHQRRADALGKLRDKLSKHFDKLTILIANAKYAKKVSEDWG